ncbi:MAG: hypothetical protein NZ927_06245 [Candidatus Calescibacterium sp.]|nr:hypothetical protein [Candidatus Calescibacterium sp.]MCX7734704.1 trigger factor [bacterium]MDW8087560.1 trigger factor [Candidatus Calescibacterium sp.]
MEISFKNISDWKFEISGKIQFDEFKEVYERELRNLAKDVKIPGFRVGNAPLDIVERRYKDEIKSKAVNAKISEILDQETSKKDKWIFVSRITNLIWNESDGSISFSLNVEVIPRKKIDTNVDFKKGANEDMKLEVSDQEVKQYIDSRREKAAVLDVSEKQEIKGEEDEVGVFDISVKDISTQRIISRAKDELISIAKSEDWFKNTVLGMKKNERKEIVVNGNRKVSITLKDIRKKVLPTDEDLSRTLGYNSEQEMYEDARKKIQDMKKKLLKDQLYIEAIRKIQEKNKIEVPVSLIETYLSRVSSSEREISREEAQSLAIFQAIEFSILLNLIEDLKIEVSDTEVDEYISKELGVGRADKLTGGVRENIKDRIKFEKARQKIYELIEI